MKWSAQVCTLVLFVAQGVAARSQQTPATPRDQLERVGPASTTYMLEPGEDPHNELVSPFLKHLATDQTNFWTGPARLQVRDLRWLLPFAGFTAGLIAGDQWVADQVPDSPSKVKTSQNISNYAVYSLVGTAGGAFVLGHLTRNDHLRETGLLSGEAAINSTAVAFALKSITQRERPLEGNGKGSFFHGGASFPSEHAALAWSVASVWAHEYPGSLSKLFAYGLASTVSLSRVTGKQHFPSDVVIGSALGWYFGRQTYRAHHDRELGGTGWGSFLEQQTADQPRNPANMGSPYVPLDSWIYPALNRLIALGYVRDAYLGMRPWTRLQCARMLEQAEEELTNKDSSGEATRVYAELATEFRAERGLLDGDRNLSASVESVYTRVTNVSGTPLRDGYHFGQTIINDFGRPFGEGVSWIGGTSLRATAGPFAFYVRGEYQHAPSIPPVPGGALQAMAQADFTPDFGPDFMPPGFSANTGSYDRFRLLEGSVSLTLRNIQLSFGKQGAWLGPTEAGPLLFSNNAEPIPMFRIDSVAPFHIPLLSRLFGPARTEFFLGQLSGLQWVYQPPTLYGPGQVRPQPFIHGNKISFKPTPNLEFGMGVVAIFGGPGLPFTFDEFVRTYYSHKSNLAQNPGKRFSAFDLTYRLPGLRNWLTGYVDSLVVDEFSPLGSTRQSLDIGLYMPRVPRLPKLELRAEGLKTAHPDAGNCCTPGNTYFDLRYISGFTNGGNLIGNWIGRAGWGGQAWATYNISPRSSLQMGYRKQHVDRQFEGGGNTSDFTLRNTYTLHREVSFSTLVQYERWNFPLLSSRPQSNFTVSLQVTYWPKQGWR